jgi:hypothetical protein
MTRLSLGVAALAVACGALRAPVLQPHTAPIPHLGINWAYGPFDPQVLNELAAYHRPLTIRAAVRSLAEATRIIADVSGRSIAARSVNPRSVTRRCATPR